MPFSPKFTAKIIIGLKKELTFAAQSLKFFDGKCVKECYSLEQNQYAG